MMETIKGLCKAEGFLLAVAAIAADREACGDSRDSKVMQEARFLASRISTGADYIIGTEKEIRELREEVKSLKKLADVEDIPGR